MQAETLGPTQGFKGSQTVTSRGRPMKRHQRWAHSHLCQEKRSSVHAGWQFVMDPDSRHVVAAAKHIINESSKKACIIVENVQLRKVKANWLVQDNARHMKKSCFLYAEFHGANHKCSSQQGILLRPALQEVPCPWRCWNSWHVHHCMIFRVTTHFFDRSLQHTSESVEVQIRWSIPDCVCKVSFAKPLRLVVKNGDHFW